MRSPQRGSRHLWGPRQAGPENCLFRNILYFSQTFFLGQRRSGTGACARGVRRRRLRCGPRATLARARVPPGQDIQQRRGRCRTMWDARFRTADCTQNALRSSRIRHMMHVLRNTRTMSTLLAWGSVTSVMVHTIHNTIHNMRLDWVGVYGCGHSSVSSHCTRESSSCTPIM